MSKRHRIDCDAEFCKRYFFSPALFAQHKKFCTSVPTSDLRPIPFESHDSNEEHNTASEYSQNSPSLEAPSARSVRAERRSSMAAALPQQETYNLSNLLHNINQISLPSLQPLSTDNAQARDKLDNLFASFVSNVCPNMSDEQFHRINEFYFHLASIAESPPSLWPQALNDFLPPPEVKKSIH